MNKLRVFLITGVTFLVIDAVWIFAVVAPAYRESLGPHMLEQARWAPAVAFYLLYITGLVVLAVLPALRQGSGRIALGRGALMGLVAYGSYALTNHALLTFWTAHLVWTDMAWGAFLSGFSSWVGWRLCRKS